MKPSKALADNREAIRRVVEAGRAANPRVFGSVLHGEDTENSDLDLLVDLTPRATIFDLCGINGELKKLLGVRVDVRTPGGLSDCFRARVMAEARPI